jgi:HEPN domain-containing protein
VYLEDLCFDAQQAAEKALKGLLIHLDISFPYTHDLADLFTLIQNQGITVPDAIKDAAILTDYAVVTRYPGVGEPVTEEEHERAVEIAERVVAWVEAHLEAGEDASNSRSD